MLYTGRSQDHSQLYQPSSDHRLPSTAACDVMQPTIAFDRSQPWPWQVGKACALERPVNWSAWSRTQKPAWDEVSKAGNGQVVKWGGKAGQKLKSLFANMVISQTREGLGSSCSILVHNTRAGHNNSHLAPLQHFHGRASTFDTAGLFDPMTGGSTLRDGCSHMLGPDSRE